MWSCGFASLLFGYHDFIGSYLVPRIRLLGNHVSLIIPPRQQNHYYVVRYVTKVVIASIKAYAIGSR